MACEEHDRLLQSLVNAMGAEDRTRDSGWVAARISVSKRLADQQSAHSARPAGQTDANTITQPSASSDAPPNPDDPSMFLPLIADVTAKAQPGAKIGSFTIGQATLI
jgi:hypothetical protein